MQAARTSDCCCSDGDAVLAQQRVRYCEFVLLAVAGDRADAVAIDEDAQWSVAAGCRMDPPGLAGRSVIAAGEDRVRATGAGPRGFVVERRTAALAVDAAYLAERCW